MTPPRKLDLSGDFRVHPFAELLIEILQAKLTGALRLEVDTKKTIIYFRDGAVVFAVSNAREHRLFVRLLNTRFVSQSDLKKVGHFSNDMDLIAELCASGVITKEASANAFVSQFVEIIVDALTWPRATWLFSPMARLRTDVSYDIEIYPVLMDYARCVPASDVTQRFKSVQERFFRSIDMVSIPRLQPQEARVLELFGDTPLNFSQLREMTAMPDAALTQSLYTLWLGGCLLRLGWNRAFTETLIADIKKTLYSRVKEALPIAAFEHPSAQPETAIAPLESDEVEAVPAKQTESQKTLDEWLARSQRAPTHYDLLDVPEDADTDVIKAAYFRLAKAFHPDRFHRETGSELRRIQVAFTTLAQAYETLKSSESRQSYDYKMRKELEAREKRRAEGVEDAQPGDGSEHALESFERGLTHFSDEEYAVAALYLARAVHYNPNNALYRAYYGKALSFDENQLHKAESELLAASKLEPQNSKIRLMLARFFIDRNLRKRAEGELRRFLEIAPDNKEAEELLASL